MKKRVLLILAFIWFIISFLVIRVTYAKYLTTINSNANITISSWKIKLNNQDIIQNSTFAQAINITFPGNEYYIADTIVPGAMRLF